MCCSLHHAADGYGQNDKYHPSHALASTLGLRLDRAATLWAESRAWLKSGQTARAKQIARLSPLSVPHESSGWILPDHRSFSCKINTESSGGTSGGAIMKRGEDSSDSSAANNTSCALSQPGARALGHPELAPVVRIRLCAQMDA